jgi:hypothetical protein
MKVRLNIQSIEGYTPTDNIEVRSMVGHGALRLFLVARPADGPLKGFTVVVSLASGEVSLLDPMNPENKKHIETVMALPLAEVTLSSTPTLPTLPAPPAIVVPESRIITP